MTASALQCSLLNLRKHLLLPFQLTPCVSKRTYAKKDQSSVSMLGASLKKKKAGKAGPVIEKRVLPVETDTNRLTTYVCGSNIYKTGEDIKLQPESEYPDWLWTLRTGKPPPLEELDKDSHEYWSRIKTMHRRRINKMKQLQRF